MVSNGDNLFYINTGDNIFLRLECTSLQDCHWITMERKLEIPRYNRPVVSLVPDELVECNWKKNTSILTFSRQNSILTQNTIFFKRENWNIE